MRIKQLTRRELSAVLKFVLTEIEIRDSKKIKI